MRKIQVEPVNGWQLTCCLLAAPIVYAFEAYLYEALAFVTLGIGNGIFYGVGGAMEGFFKSLGTWKPSGLLGLLLILIFGIILICFTIVVAVVFLIIMIPVSIAIMIAYWLVTSPGPPRYLLDLVFVWYLGMLLYGVMFPLLWRAIEPIIAHTLGEVAFQRARHRVYGERPRYSQPFYLTIAVVGIAVGGVRIVASYAGTAVDRADDAWRENISAKFYTPTPRPWPKRFYVNPHQSVSTGIVVPAQYEVAFETSATVLAAIGQSSAYIGSTSDSSRSVCVEPNYQSVSICGRRLFGTPMQGELRLSAASTMATVDVYGPPEASQRRWLSAGETWAPTTKRFRKGDAVARCAGAGLSYRMHDGKKVSAWRALSSSWSCPSYRFGRNRDDFVPSGGTIELRANQSTTWVEGVWPER